MTAINPTLGHQPQDAITADWQALVSDSLQLARNNGQSLRICGGRSKIGHVNASTELAELNLSGCRGVVDYDPSELYITARTGTPLAEVMALLRDNRQQFAFEPPHPPNATLGGMVATGITGSSMPYKGVLRNALLATRMVNGLGDSLSFGVPVIKNVAGFDVARLMAGSYGTLGVLLEVTLRVAAMSERETTLVFEADANQAVDRMVSIDQSPLPLTAQSWYQGKHFVRLCGSEQGVTAAERLLGGERLADSGKHWQEVTQHQLAEFQQDTIIIRQTCNRHQPPDALQGLMPFLIDWAGGLRWYSLSSAEYDSFSPLIQKAGAGHFWKCGRAFMLLNNLIPLSAVKRQLHTNIRHAFDPHGLCNPDFNWQ